MKKIMKKALSLVLVMAMMLVPMTTAWADTTVVNSPMDPVYADKLAADGWSYITVGANEKIYYACSVTAHQNVYVSGAHGFNLIAVDPNDGSDREPVADVIQYGDEEYGYFGAATVDIAARIMGRGGTVYFAIENTTNQEQEYYVSISEVQGTQNNPYYLVQGTNTLNTFGAYDASLFTWEAPKAGTLTITMSDNNESGWKYSIDVNDNWGETYYCDDPTIVKEQVITVEEDDVISVWVNTWENYNSPVGTVEFSMVYEASEKDPYVNSYETVYVGTNEVALDGIADVTIVEFDGRTKGTWDSLVGKYKITVPNGCTLSIWEMGEWDDTKFSYTYTKVSTVSGTVYEFNYEEAWTTVYFGLAGVGGTVTIEKTGDLDVNPNPNPNPTPSGYTEYENTVSPTPYEFKGNADNLFYVWLEEETNPTAVLGADGYYHLGSATGPVLYVDLDMDMHPYYTVAGLQASAGEGRLYHYSNKIDYSSALLEYAACKDSKTGLYPVTEDIKEIIVEYGDGQWWYNPEGPAYLFGDAEVAEESAWLFMCCYEGVVDTTATDTKWVTDSKDGFVFKVNAEISDFKELKINDKVVDAKYYTLKEGSTIITVSADYMKTLATGDYTVAAVFTNAEGEDVSFTTALTVAAPNTDSTPAPETPETPETPDTGDATNIALWVAILGLGVVAIAGSVVMKKREF